MDYSSLFKKRTDVKRSNSSFGYTFDPDNRFIIRDASYKLLLEGNIYGFASGRAYMNFVDYQYYKRHGKNILKVLNTNNRTFLKEENIKSTIQDISYLLDLFVAVRPIFQHYISYDALFKGQPKEQIKEFGIKIYYYNKEHYNFHNWERYSENGYLKKCFNILTEYVFNKKINIVYKEFAKSVYFKLLNYMDTYAKNTYNELIHYMHVSNANPIRGDFRNPVFLYPLQFAGNLMIDEVLLEGKSIPDVCKRYDINRRKFKNMVMRECTSHVFELINEDKITVENVVNTFNITEKQLTRMVFRF